MNVWVYTLIILVGLAVFYFWKFQRETIRVRAFLEEQVTTYDSMYETMALGLYHRFKLEDGKDESPWDFEWFVRDILQAYYGGTANVTPGSNDFGVDIVHKREDGAYVGQVKCYDNPVGFEPIAIIHSQIMKRGAVGGFVVTTSRFTENAIQYANDLDVDIELIDGEQLVKYWAKSVEYKNETHSPLELNPSI